MDASEENEILRAANNFLAAEVKRLTNGIKEYLTWEECEGPVEDFFRELLKSPIRYKR